MIMTIKEAIEILESITIDDANTCIAKKDLVNYLKQNFGEASIVSDEIQSKLKKVDSTTRYEEVEHIRRAFYKILRKSNKEQKADMRIVSVCTALENLKSRINKSEVITALDGLIVYLKEYFAPREKITKEIEKIIDYSESVDFVATCDWVDNLRSQFEKLLDKLVYHQKSAISVYEDSNKKKKIEAILDGETITKWMEFSGVLVTIILSIIAVCLYKFLGIGSNNDGGFNADMWGFIITLVGAVVALLFFIGAAIFNRVNRYKCFNNYGFSVDALYAAKCGERLRENKILQFLFRNAARLSKYSLMTKSIYDSFKYNKESMLAVINFSKNAKNRFFYFISAITNKINTNEKTLEYKVAKVLKEKLGNQNVFWWEDPLENDGNQNDSWFVSTKIAMGLGFSTLFIGLAFDSTEKQLDGKYEYKCLLRGDRAYKTPEYFLYEVATFRNLMLGKIIHQDCVNITL